MAEGWTDHGYQADHTDPQQDQGKHTTCRQGEDEHNETHEEQHEKKTQAYTEFGSRSHERARIWRQGANV